MAVHYPTVADFASLAKTLTTQNKILLLVATSVDCHFCEQLKSEFLQPIFLDKRYQSYAFVAELPLDRPNLPMIDFNGTTTHLADIATRYKIVGTPTMVFLAPNGTQLHQSIFGIETADFFHYTIEQALNTSHARLQGTAIHQ